MSPAVAKLEALLARVQRNRRAVPGAAAGAEEVEPGSPQRLPTPAPPTPASASRPPETGRVRKTQPTPLEKAVEVQLESQRPPASAPAPAAPPEPPGPPASAEIDIEVEPPVAPPEAPTRPQPVLREAVEPATERREPAAPSEPRPIEARPPGAPSAPVARAIEPAPPPDKPSFGSLLERTLALRPR